MALAYVKEDLKEFIKHRNFEQVPDLFYWVMFPYRGRQPPPFAEEKIPSGNDENFVSLPFSKSGFPTDYESEIRWWFYPLIFLGDLPFDDYYKNIISETKFVIGPLASETPNLGEIAIVNPKTLESISRRYVTKDGTIPPLKEISQVERYRVITEAKNIALGLKRSYPELFGETAESDSITKPKESEDLSPKHRKGKSSGFRKRIKGWSPKFARKG